ncbi:hypothetical protein OC844_003560 [Tilletia horrida]|nr:hypothetical protein OC844_003560 [Tilletia horrida]
MSVLQGEQALHALGALENDYFVVAHSLQDPETGEDYSFDFKYLAMPWSLRRHFFPAPNRYSDPAKLGPAAAQIIQLYEEIVALALQASNVVRIILNDISHMLLTYTSYKRIAPLIEGFSLKTLKLVKMIAEEEAATRGGNKAATASSLYLRLVRREIVFLVEAHKIYWSRSIVARSRCYAAYSATIVRATKNIARVTKAGKVHLRLRSTHHKLAAPQPMTPTLASNAIQHAFNSELGGTLRRLRAGRFKKTPDVEMLLRLHPFPQRIQLPDLQDMDALSNERTGENASEHGAGQSGGRFTAAAASSSIIDAPWQGSAIPSGIEGIISITRRHANPDRLQFGSIGDADQWTREATRLENAHTVLLLDGGFLARPDAARYLHSMLTAYSLVGFWGAASFVAEMLATSIRDALALDPSSTPLKLSLCNALATLSLLCGPLYEPLLQLGAVEEAGLILKELSVGKPDRYALEDAQFALLLSQGKRKPFDEESQQEGDEMIEDVINKFARVLKKDPSCLEARLGLAISLGTAEYYKLADGTDSLAAAAAVYEQLATSKPLLFGCAARSGYFTRRREGWRAGCCCPRLNAPISL